MDSRVAVRFFRASPSPRGVAEFGDILEQVVAAGGPADRERDIGNDVVVRLEGCAANGPTIEGDFCRVQRVNIPPQAGAGGLAPIQLAQGNGIGHMAAFLYHRPTRVLALQTNMQSATPNRVAQYLATLDPAQIFHLQPVLTEDAIERFRAGRPRSFTVKFAGIDNLNLLDDGNVAVARGAKMVADAYDGLEVEIKVSVGRRRDHWLAQGPLTDFINRFSGDPSVSKLEAKMEGDERKLDLLHEQLQSSSELRLPENDPARHYGVRRDYLRNAFRDSWPTLQRQFGGGDGDNPRRG